MQLPTGESIGPSDIEKVCALISLAVENGEALSRRLSVSSVPSSP
jgi:hypothetical protein